MITDILTRAAKLKIAVVGDYITDRYIDGVVERISPEAPVPILRITGTRENPGGAGNVVENLKGIGCEVSSFYQNIRPIKTRIMSGNHHLLRMDDESNAFLMHWDEIDIGLGYGIENNKFDCVVISDYSKGMCSKEVVAEIIGRCKCKDIPVVVDTKKNLDYYSEASLVKCNQKEWGDYFINSKIEAQAYMDKYTIDDLVITNGANGMIGFNRSYHEVKGISVNISDSCGAGDTVTAVLAVMKTLKYGLLESMTLANIAASEVCKHPGVYAIKKDDLIKIFILGVKSI